MDVKEWLPLAVRDSAIERKLDAGQVLFSVGDRAAGLYEVVSGRVKVTRIDSAGRELVLRVACAGDSFAEPSIFSPIYHTSAEAVTPALVRFYRKAVLLAELAHNPQFTQSFMTLLARKAADLVTRLERLNIHSARERVRHYLAAGAEEGTIALHGTVKDLAAELGLTHEALYRTLSGMEAAGEIARLNGKIRLAKRFNDGAHCEQLHPGMSTAGVVRRSEPDAHWMPRHKLRNAAARRVFPHAPCS
jgi:CRP-like cAMP-binding protein